MNRISSFCEAVMRPATVSNCGFLVRDGASAAIVDRLLMMDDHHLHEGDVGGGEARVGDARRLDRGDDPDRGAGRAGLDDADRLRRGGRQATGRPRGRSRQ